MFQFVVARLDETSLMREDVIQNCKPLGSSSSSVGSLLYFWAQGVSVRSRSSWLQDGLSPSVIASPLAQSIPLSIFAALSKTLVCGRWDSIPNDAAKSMTGVREEKNGRSPLGCLPCVAINRPGRSEIRSKSSTFQLMWRDWTWEFFKFPLFSHSM